MPRQQVSQSRPLKQFLEAAKDIAKEAMQQIGQKTVELAESIGSPAEKQFAAGSLQAAGRQGFKELGAAFGKALPDSIQIDEPGAIGNITPQLVTEQITGRQVDLEMDR